MNLSVMLLVFLYSFATSCVSAAESSTVVLENGAEITAPVLRDDAQGLVLDLGTTVITIPTEAIVTKSTPVVETDAEQVSSAHSDVFSLYHTGRMQEKSVAELVNAIGDGVVMVKTPRGLGSGFLINNDGYLITNYHVVEEEVRITVMVFIQDENGSYKRKELKQVSLVALQPLRDLALLRIDMEELGDFVLPHVVMNYEDPVAVGDAIFAIGNPLGLERSVTKGIVSSITRTIGHLRFVQTDASINPGNSGGPMFNTRGELIGVVCAGHSLFAGLAFGIPVSDVIDFLNNKDAYLFDPSQPQNGKKYMPPPSFLPHGPDNK